ncbi:MAG: AzlC family ABC transporter permease [Candidatus Nanopelagicales bacterium]
MATGAYALSFGAISVASGLDVWQTQILSLGMFTGASQFALVGVLGAGGGTLAAVLTALLLGARNSLYALSLRPVLDGGSHPAWWRILGRAHLTIDESTAMAIRYPAGSRQARHAFIATGLSIFVLWNLGTLIGALGATALDDPRVLGLDAAVPAGFIALLWPRLRDRSAIALAVVSAAVAIALVPVLQPGLPVLAAALVAVIAERVMARSERAT